MVSPHAALWFAEVVKSVVRRSGGRCLRNAFGHLGCRPVDPTEKIPGNRSTKRLDLATRSGNSERASHRLPPYGPFTILAVADAPGSAERVKVARPEFAKRSDGTRSMPHYWKNVHSV